MGYEEGYCGRAVEYARDGKVPAMDELLNALFKAQGAPPETNHTWFGSGHQIILGGLFPALAAVLGDSAGFVRMRRNRLDVAYSFDRKEGGPCTSSCVYCLCPFDASTLLVVPGGLWDTFSG